MAVLPRVVSPLVQVYEHDGVEVLLVSVEAWPDEVVVRLRGQPSAVTERLAAEFESEFAAAYSSRAAVPVQPADRIFDIDVSVTDNLGTHYSPRGSARGGSARLFRAEWFFVPGPPGGASELFVDVSGTETRVRLQ